MKTFIILFRASFIKLVIMKLSIKSDLARNEINLTRGVFGIKTEFKNYGRENKREQVNRNNFSESYFFKLYPPKF